MYILIEFFTGTCSGCFNRIHRSYNELISDALDKAYISTSLTDIETYYLKKLDNESVYRHNLYNIK